ncbi:MAG: hypothetical protein ACR2JV_04860 [Gaiellales bacterium]
MRASSEELEAAEGRIADALESGMHPQLQRLLAIESTRLLDADAAFRASECADACHDRDLAHALREIAALKGHAEAALTLGVLAGDPATGLSWLETALDLGHPEAEALLAHYPGADDVPLSGNGMLCLQCGEAHGGPPRMRYCEDCRDTAAPWRPDPWAIARAGAVLGISRPVRVIRVGDDRWDVDDEHRVTRRGAYAGFLLVDDDDPRAHTLRPTEDELPRCVAHVIVMPPRLTADDASFVLWHELAHAMQHDQDPFHADERYRAEWERVEAERTRRGLTHLEAHRLHAMEIEAHAIEHELGPTITLTRANRRAALPHLDPPHETVAAVIDGRVIPGEHAERGRRDREQVRRRAFEAHRARA